MNGVIKLAQISQSKAASHKSARDCSRRPRQTSSAANTAPCSRQIKTTTLLELRKLISTNG